MPSRERQLKLAGYSLRELDLDHIVSNHKWPAKHTDTFTHVTTVGKTDYEKYFESLTIETQNTMAGSNQTPRPVHCSLSTSVPR
jgi:hypothetical protein